MVDGFKYCGEVQKNEVGWRACVSYRQEVICDPE